MTPESLPKKPGAARGRNARADDKNALLLRRTFVPAILENPDLPARCQLNQKPGAAPITAPSGRSTVSPDRPTRSFNTPKKSTPIFIRINFPVETRLPRLPRLQCSASACLANAAELRHRPGYLCP